MQLNIVAKSFINVLRAYLNTYYANDSVRYFSPHSRYPRVVQSTSWPVRKMSSPRVGNPRADVSASCPVTPLHTFTPRMSIFESAFGYSGYFLTISHLENLPVWGPSCYYRKQKLLRVYNHSRVRIIKLLKVLLTILQDNMIYIVL